MEATVLNYDEMQSPIGPLVLAATDSGLCNIEFGAYKERQSRLQSWSARWFGDEALWQHNPPALADAVRQLEQYFAGERRSFELKLDMRGTPFQLKVWSELCRIPYGETRSYKQIAEGIGNVKAVRAIGGANHNNPVAIVVPCHRVIGAGGDMVGYGGGLPIKTFLLELEQPAKVAGAAANNG
ncbi:methylated-DNA--[protein]-cysteine S-methyltransferase [Paenibacillus hamazuiensis]|uniref:methylated-DNA--[protein]-cysteine S-methyltransferase n=1 Tax=Paenibacillus hamazuiensis TaxID=2936508 RepID=UPI00200CA15A|nr:methylated-DNA--[protein]-cysteine S-methyltransferase [Paenibacillus hamazuiensis]